MSLTKETVQHVAKLASLAVSDERAGALTTDLSEILAFVEKLNEVDTTGVAPTSHVHGVVNAFRDDVAKESLSLSDVEQLAPDFAHGGFRVPKVI